MAKTENRARVGKQGYWRLQLTLPKRMDLFLARLGEKSKAMGGFKMRKTQVIRALIALLMELDVDVSGVTTEAELKGRILEAMRKRHGSRRAKAAGA